MIMNRLAALILLDFRLMSVLRKICLFILPILTFCVFFLFNFLPERLGMTIGFLLIFVSIIIAQPYTRAAQGRLDMFFATLPVTQGDIVKAIYLIFIFLQAIFVLPPLLIKLLFFPDNERIYPYIIFVFLIASCCAAITYLVLFLKYQGVFLSMSISFFSIIIGNFSKCGLFEDACTDTDLLQQFIVDSPVKSVAAGLLILCLSCLLSHKFYRVKSEQRVIEDSELCFLKLN